MPEIPPHRSDVIAEIRELLGCVTGAPSLEALERYTRRQLLDWAERLGLVGLGRLTKNAIAERCQQALETLGLAPTETRETPPTPPEAGEPADPSRKFDVGRAVERPMPAHIPWGYGRDRVTAMAIDPERMFVYWEATDDGIARAREGLGPGGEDAWLNLRVYDVTGRLFDGTNANGYFDHRVERSDRQWFFTIGKPTSTAVVDLGMKSFEGYFVRIRRSGRVDFPRREPAPPGDVGWLTVQAATGEPGPRVASAPAGPSVADRRAPNAAATVDGGEDAIATAWPEAESTPESRGAVERTTWEAGPFSYPVESPRYVEERDGGRVTIRRDARWTRIVYGPWRVVIRGIGGRVERRVVATWELEYSRRGDPGGDGRGGVRGSEPRLGASELRPGGASELYRIGASELRFAGASERRLGGASEWRLLGASERRLGGSSERRVLGGSERRLGGPSERTYPTGLRDAARKA